MALISDATTTWSAPLTLTRDEVWQARTGSVYITTTDTPVPGDGLMLHQTHAIQVSAGSVVRYRKEGPGDAIIARETV